VKPAGIAQVSVVIPCFNYGRFLASAIGSVIAQSYGDIEVIVVDDGSTDDTWAVAGRYPTVRRFQQQNLGPGAASNLGLREASGEFVVFLDADDELTSDAVETSVRCLQERPDCALVYGHQQSIDTSGAVITTEYQAGVKRDSKVQTCVQDDPYAVMLRSNSPLRSPGGVLYRTETVKAIDGFAHEVGNAQDLDLNLRVAREHPICCNDRIVLLKRFHDENAMLRAGTMLRSAVRAQRRQRRFVTRHPAYKRDYQMGLRLAQSHWGGRLAAQIRSGARAGEIGSAARDFGTLARYAPRIAVLTILRTFRARLTRSAVRR
jgi:glycosyltransferase involved in cell wall biosynthesis